VSHLKKLELVWCTDRTFTMQTLVDVVPKEALLWKLKMLHSAALYTNSRLHAVRAEVLVLASGKDQMLPSAEEAKRLKKAIPGCRVRYFKESGHTLLLVSVTWGTFYAVEFPFHRKDLAGLVL
jgi:hypothetical protein